MWKVHLKGFEEFEKDFDFKEDRDFVYIFNKGEDTPIAFYIRSLNLDKLKDYLSDVKSGKEAAKTLNYMFWD